MPGLASFVARSAGLAMTASLVVVASVGAHGGRTVIVEPPIAPPGSEVAIHGDFLWTDMPVVITLAGTSAPREPIATALTDGQGHLEARATLPDLRAGKYRIIVTAEDGETVEAELIVQTGDLLLPIAIGFGTLILVVLGVGAWMP